MAAKKGGHFALVVARCGCGERGSSGVYEPSGRQNSAMPHRRYRSIVWTDIVIIPLFLLTAVQTMDRYRHNDKLGDLFNCPVPGTKSGLPATGKPRKGNAAAKHRARNYFSSSFSTKGATLQRSTVKMRVALGSMPWLPRSPYPSLAGT